MQDLEHGGEVVRMLPPDRLPRSRSAGRRILIQPPGAEAPVSERWLVRSAARGDAAAWESLCAHYVPLVWQWALELRVEEDAAHRLCQIVWLRFAQVLPDFDGSVRGWLRQEVVNESWRARRLAASR